MSETQQQISPSGEPLFIIKDLTKTYVVGEVAIHALRGVNAEIRKGESIVLLGPSGSGKSTFLNILGGLDTPTSGEIFFQGQSLNAFQEKALTHYRRRYVGFVFQFYNLIPSLTALENVTLITDIAEKSMSAKEALEIVGLKERLHHFPAQLSGGEQQRVAIARALAKSPEILLCDEPTGALDFETGILVLEALNKVNRELGTTMVLITHNAGIAKMADRVMHLADGQIAQIEHNATKIEPSELSW